MEKVHIFISAGRFRSSDELRCFVEATYTEDGDNLPSLFMREVRLTSHEPGCIETIYRERAVPLAELLTGASYSDQWLHKLGAGGSADSAICVFAPNRLSHPNASSLKYLGAFDYSAR